MTSARKMAKQRAARQRQQAQLENLQRGAQELAQRQTSVDPNDPNGGRAGNPDDPLGQVMGGSANVRVISAPGVQPSGKQRVGARKSNKRSATSVTIVEKKKARSSTRVTSTPQRTPDGAPMSYGSGRVISTPQRQAPLPAGVQEQQAPPQQVGQHHPNMVMQPPPQVATAPPADVTVILTCFERPQLLRQQLQALRSQTVQPRATMAWVNTGQVAHDEQALQGSGLVTMRVNANLGPWARFTFAMEAPTTYVCILDDDTIPGPKWLETAIARLEEAEANEDEITYCIAAAGEIYRTDDPNDRYFVGPESPRPEELEVDIGRQGWVFRRELLSLFTSFPRTPDPRIGWGLHFAAALQAEGILTVVLPYATDDQSGWGMLQPPSKDRALSSIVDPTAMGVMRTAMYQHYRSAGWFPLVLLDQMAEAEEAAEADEAEDEFEGDESAEA